MPTSDLPYVQAQDRLERVNPTLEVNIGDWTDQSGTIAEADTPQQLFALADESICSRFVTNVAVNGTLWVNWLGGAAAKNAPGSMPVKPGAMLWIPTRAVVSILGDTDGMPFTAGEA